MESEKRPSRYRVLLIENRHILRCATKALLDSTGNFEVVAHVERWTDALQLYLVAQPDVILLGTEKGDFACIQAAEELLDKIPLARILMLVFEWNEEAIPAAIPVGLCSFVSMSATLSDLIHALETVASGGHYPGDLAEVSVSHFGQAGARSAPTLAPREFRVVRLIAQGLSSKEIANSLGLAVETVRYYRKSAMRKVNVHNVAGLLKVANSKGFIPQALGQEPVIRESGSFAVKNCPEVTTQP